MNIIFFDVETSGLPRIEAAPLQQQPFITEICAIKTDEDCNIIDKYIKMFKVPYPLDPKVKEITGITDEMLADKNPFITHFREIADFYFGVTKMVAHNVSFDRTCLMYEVKRCGKLLNFPWPIEHECTVEQSFSFKGFRLNLGKLHEHLFGESFDGAHRAEADVEALIKCYKKMHKKGEYADGKSN